MLKGKTICRRSFWLAYFAVFFSVWSLYEAEPKPPLEAPATYSHPALVAYEMKKLPAPQGSGPPWSRSLGSHSSAAGSRPR
jgi:hypothetical protein